VKHRIQSLGLLCFLLWNSAQLNATITLFVEEPYGVLGSISPTGHAAIYLNRVCAETPTVLRRCRAGELGAVIGRYMHVSRYDWAAVSLIPYLYAVDSADEVPEWVDAATLASLRQAYLRKHLQQFMPDDSGREKLSSGWIQLIGAAYIRRIYGLEIHTTDEQDDRFIAEFNSKPNRSHFNFFLHNCADFSRKVIDFYYPKAVRRSFTADLGMTTPKQIAKSLAQFGRHDPDLQLAMFTIPQIPGELGRSHDIRGVCEALVRSKKYVVPLVIFHPWLTTGFLLGYLATGRFNLAHDAGDAIAEFRQPEEVEISPGSTRVEQFNAERGRLKIADMDSQKEYAQGR
jgi:hypothetical protein